MRSSAASLAVALVLVAAGCGGAEEESSGSPPPPPPPPPPPATTETEPIVGATDVGIYFVRDGKLGFAERSVGITPLIATATLEELLAGPTAAEQDAGLTSDIPPNTKIVSLEVEDGQAIVALSNPLDRLGSLQVVHTLAQLETVDRVQLGQEEFASADTEEVLPAILVESPAPGDTVASPLTIRGTANTFEATFMV